MSYDQEKQVKALEMLEALIEEYNMRRDDDLKAILDKML